VELFVKLYHEDFDDKLPMVVSEWKFGIILKLSPFFFFLFISLLHFLTTN